MNGFPTASRKRAAQAILHLPPPKLHLLTSIPPVVLCLSVRCNKKAEIAIFSSRNKFTVDEPESPRVLKPGMNGSSWAVCSL
jgi:hypothetical protein